MQKWIVTLLVVVVLVVLAITSAFWLPGLLEFAGANADTIQGLTGLGQLILWAGAIGVFVFGLWRKLET